jgi:hypothetical protein
MKFIFKWLFRLFILAVVLIGRLPAVVYNSILRVVIEHNIRAQTGMDAEIGSFKLALTSPTIEIQNFKLYNSRRVLAARRFWTSRRFTSNTTAPRSRDRKFTSRSCASISANSTS